MNFIVKHKTHYKYTKPVQFSYNEVRLHPRNFDYQTCQNSAIIIDPDVDDFSKRLDFFDNETGYFSVTESHTELVVEANSEVSIGFRTEPDLESGNQDWKATRESILTSDDPAAIYARQFTLESPFVYVTPEITDFAGKVFDKQGPLLLATYKFMNRIFNDFSFDSNVTTVSTPVNDVLKNRRGVCQDFAHLSISCLRSLGLPARYVSGYIETKPPPGKDKLVGADASHAWFSVFDPVVGWVDFDPTNNKIPTDQHVVLAWGRDYSDVTPLKGVIFGGGRHSVSVSVDVLKSPE